MDVDVGDRVKIDIPRQTQTTTHGEHGTVKDALHDDAELVTGNPDDSQLIRVDLEQGGTIDVRARDVRPPIN